MDQHEEKSTNKVKNSGCQNCDFAVHGVCLNIVGTELFFVSIDYCYNLYIIHTIYKILIAILALKKEK